MVMVMVMMMKAATVVMMMMLSNDDDEDDDDDDQDVVPNDMYSMLSRYMIYMLVNSMRACMRAVV